MKPFAESCETNKYPILNIIQNEFSQCQRILEIGSGTGQHAVYFSQSMPHLSWQPSEQKEYLTGIQMWIDEYSLLNTLTPIELEVCQSQLWPEQSYDGAFSANTTHIMSWPQVKCMFQGIGNVLRVNSPFCLYGPFNFKNKYTSESNAQFDQRLKQRDPESGIKNFEDLDLLAKNNGFVFKKDYPMPMNNRTLVWIKQ